MIKIESIEAFTDNYIWLVTTNEGSIVIDPGESSNVINHIDKNQLDLKAIFITHHHLDHTGGVDEITSYYPVDVFGPNNNIETISKRLRDGDEINIIGIEFQIIEIPGHTLDHIAYYSKNNFTAARKPLSTLLRLTDSVTDDEDLLKLRVKAQELMNKMAFESQEP